MASRPWVGCLGKDHAMPEYEVVLYYTGFVFRTVQAESEKLAILKARDELNAPCNRVHLFNDLSQSLRPSCHTMRGHCQAENRE